MSQNRDTRDVWALVRAYMDTRRCPGGRLVHAMYCCIHCGEDPSTGHCRGVKPFIKGEGPSYAETQGRAET